MRGDSKKLLRVFVCIKLKCEWSSARSHPKQGHSYCVTHLLRQNGLHFQAQKSDCVYLRHGKTQKCGTSKRSKCWRLLVICMARRIWKDAIRTTHGAHAHSTVTLIWMCWGRAQRVAQAEHDKTRALAKVHRRYRGLRVCARPGREISGCTSRRRHWQTQSRSSLLLGTRRTVVFYFGVRRDTIRKEHPPASLRVCVGVFSPFAISEHRWTETSARRVCERKQRRRAPS